MSDTDVLAFLNHVITETNQIVVKTSTGQPDKARELAALLCSQAARKKRELLGLPEPDPDVDYDEDYHADGTPRLNGEPRREKGEAFSDSLDLSALKPEL